VSKAYGYHAKWKQVIAGRIAMPDSWRFGKHCHNKDHIFEGKTLRRKSNNMCIACDVNYEHSQAKPRTINNEAYAEIRKKKLAAEKRMAEIEEAKLSKEAYFYDFD
jgi:hypothetical protein